MKKIFCFILCYVLCLCILYGSLRMANAETIVSRQSSEIFISVQDYKTTEYSTWAYSTYKYESEVKAIFKSEKTEILNVNNPEITDKISIVTFALDGVKYTIPDIFCIPSVDIYTNIWIQNKENFHIKNCRYSKGSYCIHSQDIVDVDHLALAQTTYDGNIHICDHVNQDFENLKYVKPGDIAYIEINGVKTYYICVENELGKSYIDSGKTYKGWNIWYGAYKPNGYIYPLVCSTCTNLDGIITVVVFDYYEEEN